MTNQAVNVSFPEYYQELMKHLNALNLVYRNANADTWPELRDAELTSQGMLAELCFLSFEQVDSPTKEDTIH